MYTVSSCCLRSIEPGIREEAPLGGQFNLRYQVEVCSCCGKEVEDTVDVTECCGLERCVCSDANVSTAS
jgi:hypothetical protein